MRAIGNKEQVERLIRKYEADKSYYHSERYNETLLRSDFLDPLFEALGWDIKNNAGLSISEREVLLEEPLKAEAAEHTKKPDYTFRLFAERKFFLEAKKPSVSILTNPSPAQQIRRYGFTAGLKISVLSNFEDLAIYDMSVSVSPNDSVSKALIKKYHYTEYAECFDELARLLGHDSVYNGTFDKEWNDLGARVEKTAPVDAFFLGQINSWRVMLGKEIYNAYPTIDLGTLNDSVQSYMNKILFLRVCEDRNIEVYKGLLSLADKGDFTQLISKFHAADRKYNSGLFASAAADKLLSSEGVSFWSIIRQLYYPECPYSFSVLSSDVLGRIYELFLTQKLSVVDGELQLADKPENVDKDVVSTPTYIIRELLSKSVKVKCEGLSFEEITQMSFADIACGSGAFLLELYGLLCDIAIDYFVEHDRSALIQTSVGTYRLGFAYKKKILTSCIYGVDKDYNAVEATKFGLLLKLLENEDVNTVSDIHPILPRLDDNIVWGNSIIDSNMVEDQDSVVVNPYDFKGISFDVIVGNPPYMKTEDMKNITPLEFGLYKQYYQTAYKQFDKYFLFIERAIGLLKEKGVLAFIVPNKFMKVGAGMKLRKMISSSKCLSDLTSFGANLVFADKSTYTCLVVLNKQPQQNFRYTEVNDIDRWIAKNNTAYSCDIKSESAIGKDTWILYPNSLDEVFHSIMDKSITLSSIVGKNNIFNGIQTSAVQTYVIDSFTTDAEYIYFKHNGKDYKIEKRYTRPFFKTSRGDDALNTYHTFKPNSVLIYPYERKDDRVIDIVPLQQIQAETPNLYAYLIDNKNVLSAPGRSILPKPDTNDEWHRYGRHQSLGMDSVKTKIIVGVLSRGNKYGIDTNGVFLASGGTAGYCAVGIPDDSLYSPYYIQAVLSSKYVEWIASLRGEIFRGGFIARGTKVLKDMPIRKINFNNEDEKKLHGKIAMQQKKLIELGDMYLDAKDDKRKSIVLQRKLNHELDIQNVNLRILYDISELKEKQLPIISELYAAD